VTGICVMGRGTRERSERAGGDGWGGGLLEVSTGTACSRSG